MDLPLKRGAIFNAGAMLLIASTVTPNFARSTAVGLCPRRRAGEGGREEEEREKGGMGLCMCFCVLYLKEEPRPGLPELPLHIDAARFQQLCVGSDVRQVLMRNGRVPPQDFKHNRPAQDTHSRMHH